MDIISTSITKYGGVWYALAVSERGHVCLANGLELPDGNIDWQADSDEVCTTANGRVLPD